MLMLHFPFSELFMAAETTTSIMKNKGVKEYGFLIV